MRSLTLVATGVLLHLLLPFSGDLLAVFLGPQLIDVTGYTAAAGWAVTGVGLGLLVRSGARDFLPALVTAALSVAYYLLPFRPADLLFVFPAYCLWLIAGAVTRRANDGGDTHAARRLDVARTAVAGGYLAAYVAEQVLSVGLLTGLLGLIGLVGTIMMTFRFFRVAARPYLQPTMVAE
ncbi:hypothetical protein [Nonomuraea sp. NPDC050310]|uniref:hypothetical protein n=1 Tax=Nonomuraea sp. NPDC050310 TaxID=3154935 RepID=UPI003405C8CC